MKALEILTPIDLKNDITLPSGTIVTIQQMVQTPKEFISVTEGKNTVKKIPNTIMTLSYASQAAHDKKAEPIDSTEFKRIYKMLLTEAEFGSENMETLSINFVKAELEKLYPAKIQIINVDLI